MMSGSLPDFETEQDVRERANEKKEVRVPPLYCVLLLNDDFTPMEFVIAVLESVFHKSGPEAFQVMMSVHTEGVGECGVYTHEIAEAKVDQVMRLARESEHPLQCVLEAT